MRFLKFFLLILILILSFSACNNEEETQPDPVEAMYFPSNADAAWETKSPSSQKWNEAAIENLNEYLIQAHTIFYDSG